MKIKIEKDDIKTSTTITERFAGSFLGTETTTESVHIKLYPIDSNTFSFSVTNQIVTHHSHGSPPPPPPIHQLEHVILDEHLVSKAICCVHLRNLLSNISLQPSTEEYIILYISTEAIYWKTHRKGGCKVEVNVKVNVDYKERDGEISLTELSSEVSRMELGCSDETKKKKKTTTERSHVSTLKISKEQIKGCILDKEIFTKKIQIKTRSNESNRFSFSLNYEKKQEIHHGNLDGHKIRVTLSRPVPGRMNKTEYAFPDQFHISEEACGDQLLIVLSEIDLPSKTREYLVLYLSREAVLWDRRNGEGIIVEIKVKDNVDRSFEVESCSGEEDGCSSRISRTRMAETECAICLKGLSSEVSRMELSCSHLFHKDCVMTWLHSNPSCPLCRNNVVDRVAFYC